MCCSQLRSWSVFHQLSEDKRKRKRGKGRDGLSGASYFAVGNPESMVKFMAQRLDRHAKMMEERTKTATIPEPVLVESKNKINDKDGRGGDTRVIKVKPGLVVDLDKEVSQKKKEHNIDR